MAGGSEGLGGAFAGELARRGLSLVLVARRPGPLAATAARLRREYPVEIMTVAADLALPGAAGEVAAATAGLPVGLLITNAAHAPAGPFAATDAADVTMAVDLNCRAAALLAHAFLPAMVERGRGGVVLMSSLAGLQGVPGLAVYSASKAFLVSLGQALWAETRAAGVDVVVSSRARSPLPATSRRPGAPPRGPCHRPRSPWPRWTRSATASGIVPGRLNRMNTYLLERVLPRRAAIAVFGRATAAALNEPGGAMTAPPTTEPPTTGDGSTRY